MPQHTKRYKSLIKVLENALFCHVCNRSLLKSPLFLIYQNIYSLSTFSQCLDLVGLVNTLKTIITRHYSTVLDRVATLNTSHALWFGSTEWRLSSTTLDQNIFSHYCFLILFTYFDIYDIPLLNCKPVLM